jgi:hypothetical protein
MADLKLSSSISVLRQTAAKVTSASAAVGKTNLEKEEEDLYLKLINFNRDNAKDAQEPHPSFKLIPKFHQGHQQQKKSKKCNHNLSAAIWFESMYSYLETELSLMVSDKVSIPRAKFINREDVRANNEVTLDSHQQQCYASMTQSEDYWVSIRTRCCRAVTSMVLDLYKATLSGVSTTNAREQHPHLSKFIFHTSTPDDNSGRINYDDLQGIKEILSPFLQRILTARFFLQFECDAYGRACMRDLIRSLAASAFHSLLTLDFMFYSLHSAIDNYNKTQVYFLSSSPQASSSSSTIHSPEYELFTSSQLHGTIIDKILKSDGRVCEGGLLEMLCLNENDMTKWVRSHINHNNNLCPLLRPGKTIHKSTPSTVIFSPTKVQMMNK